MALPIVRPIGRKESIRHHQDQGGTAAAVLPIHYPRSLFRAFNILPVEVWGPPSADPSLAARHLQPYICSIARNALAFLLSGGLEAVDYLVVPHTCDSLQGLGSILIDFIKPRQTVLVFYLPRGRRDSDLAFLAAEFQRLFGQLKDLTGLAPTDGELLACIEQEEEADALLQQLHESRLSLPLDNLAFYRLLRSREYLPAESFIPLARQALDSVPLERKDGLPLIISGIVPEPMTMLDFLSVSGATVVADDLACCGRRLYPAGTSSEPFQRMAERILRAPPDPTRGSPIADRARHLVQMAERTGACGVIFYEIKFCEPELFDLPELRGHLQAAGLPSLVVEMDVGDPLSYQVRTRLESFLEMLQ